MKISSNYEEFFNLPPNTTTTVGEFFRQIYLPPHKHKKELIVQEEKEHFHGQKIIFRGSVSEFFFISSLIFIPSMFLAFWLYPGSSKNAFLYTIGTANLLWVISYLIFHFFFHSKRQIIIDDAGIQYRDEKREFTYLWKDIEAIIQHSITWSNYFIEIRFFNGESLYFTASQDINIHKYRDRFSNIEHPILELEDAEILLAFLFKKVSPETLMPNLVRQKSKFYWFHLVSLETFRDTQEEQKQKQENFEKELLNNHFSFDLPLSYFLYIKNEFIAIIKAISPLNLAIFLAIQSFYFPLSFNLIILFAIMIHELGHAWMLRQSGEQVENIYLLPFLGGITISGATIYSNYLKTKVFLYGPLWGTFGAIICLVLTQFIPFNLREFILFGITLNLLNLYPLPPLDGGRALTVILENFHPYIKSFFLFTMILVTFISSFYFQSIFIYSLAMLGIFHFLIEYYSNLTRRKIQLLTESKKLTAEDFLILQSFFQGVDIKEKLEEQERLITQTYHHPIPLNTKEVLYMLTLYIGMIFTLSYLLYTHFKGYLLYILKAFS